MTVGEEPQAGPVRCDTLLTGGIVVTVDSARPVIEGGFVAITGDRIVAVGDGREAANFVATRRISCEGKLVMPGLIDCHTHSFQTLGRTLGEGLTGWEWLSQFMWPYAAQITPEETLASVYMGAVEAVLSGSTTVLDHHYGRTDVDTTLAVADALEEVGLRGKVARGIAGPYTDLARRQQLPETAFPHSADAELEMTDECMRARPKGSKIEIWAGPINVVYTQQELLAASVALARAHGLGWHTHVSAPQSDPVIYMEAYGVRPASWLHREGLLGPDAVLAHTTWLDEAEIEAIGSTQTAVAHCPASNQYVPYGVMPMRELLDAGATVGLGTDGSACGHRQSMFQAMKLFVLMHRLHDLDPKATGAPEALDLATRGGAAAHSVEAGVLAAGSLADVIVIDATKAHLAPLHRPNAGIVYSVGGTDVEMNIIGGEIVVEDGRCVLVDQDTIIADAQRHGRALMERIGLHQLATP